MPSDGTTNMTEDTLDHIGARDQLEAARQEVDQLRQGIEAHAVVDEARGVLMAVHGVDAEHAWRLLSHASSHSNTKIRRLAEALTAMAGGRPTADPDAAKVVVNRLLRPAAGDRVAAEFIARLIKGLSATSRRDETIVSAPRVSS